MRYTYWSNSKLSIKIREMFGLTNPIYLSSEGWDEWEEECNKKAKVVHWITNKGFDKLQNIVMFPADVWRSIRTATIWKFFRNLWLFRKCLWNYQSWDYSGLLMFMETASRDMHECHKNHGHLMRSDKTAKELLIFSNLCKRIREDEYSVGRLEFDLGCKSVLPRFDNKPNTLPSRKSKSFHKLCEKMKQNDLELLSKMIRTKLLTWWD